MASMHIELAVSYSEVFSFNLIFKNIIKIKTNSLLAAF